MKAGVQITLLLILFNFQLNAQKGENDFVKNEIFVELGGPSIIVSLNYKRRFALQENTYISGRIGLGVVHIKDFTYKFNPDILIPIGVDFNYIFHKFTNSQLSCYIGVGNVISSIVVLDKDYSPKRSLNYSGYMNIGLKWHIKKHLNLGLSYTPILENYSALRHWGGISIGYLF